MAAVDRPTNETTGARKRTASAAALPETESKRIEIESKAEPKNEEKGKGKGKGKDERRDPDLRPVSDAMCRAGFLKKVYGILTAQVLFTVAVAATSMYVEVVRNTFFALALGDNAMLRWGLFIPTILSVVILKCGAKDRYPSNYIMLSIFTTCISINVGYVCAIAEASGLGHLVFQAFCATAATFLGLTLYTFYSGKDFSYWGAVLSVLLWGLVLIGFLGFLFPALTGSLVFGFVGGLTFCGYILYDTSRLLKHLSYDDYILASIELYLDVVNLFLYILDILMKLAKDSKE